MKKFEKEVSYFINLAFNNIKSARNKLNKRQIVFTDIKINKNGKEVTIFNKEQHYFYTLRADEIKNFYLNQELPKYIALIYIDKLTKYLNKEITYNELSDIGVEMSKTVKDIVEQKSNITEQLILLRRSRDKPEVQKFITNLYKNTFTSEYIKYLIDRYFYNKKNLIKPKKNCIERMFKITLH